ncbi:hypothetical protein JCM5350_000864 [Sporobolomyces pararoseus]
MVTTLRRGELLFVYRLGGCRQHFSSTSNVAPPRLSSLSTSQDMEQAREWIGKFSQLSHDNWPKHLYETSFARSSGPGGQHVNRTLSKAILRFPLPSSSFLPPYLLPHLYRSPHFSQSPPSLLISSSTSRSQAQNLDECFKKCKDTILNAARKDLVGETSEEQKERVKGLVKKEKAKVEKIKKLRKDVKSSRGKVKGWE